MRKPSMFIAMLLAVGVTGCAGPRASGHVPKQCQLRTTVCRVSRCSVRCWLHRHECQQGGRADRCSAGCRFGSWLFRWPECDHLRGGRTHAYCA